jgi:hypothetical protein
MSLRDRAIAAAVVAGIHLIALGLLIGEPSESILDGVFHVQAEEILDGALPYADRGYEYPPLSLPLVLAPGVFTDSELAYRQAFGWEMMVFDLAIVALLAFALRGDSRRIWGALAVYTVGIVGLSGLGPLPDSDIELAPLGLARFDLAPAALVLAAALAREASRSATWSALLSTAVAVKAFPLVLFPNFLRGERDLRRVAVATALPLLTAAGIVLVTGDEFGSAIDYHSGRGLQIESVGANLFLVAHLLGAGASTTTEAGAYALEADGAGFARGAFFAIWLAVLGWLIWTGWQRQTPPLRIATAILAATVVLAPILSPQFLFWLLPVSAAAFGLRLPNLLLMAAALLTQFMLSEYGGVKELDNAFIFVLTARNIVLVAYAVAAIAWAFRPGEQGARPQPA